MTLKFNNIEKLRDHMLDCLEKLSQNKIDIDEVSIIAKGIETVNSSIKLQLAYSQMRDEKPNINFLQSCNKGEVKMITHEVKMIEGKAWRKS